MTFTLEGAPDFEVPDWNRYRKFKRLLAEQGTLSFQLDPTLQGIPIAVITNASQLRNLATRPSALYSSETGSTTSNVLQSQILHVRELLRIYGCPISKSPSSAPHPGGGRGIFCAPWHVTTIAAARRPTTCAPTETSM